VKKTIILVGVVDKESSTNLAQAKYFELLGYKVIPINYRTILQQHKSFEYLFGMLEHAVEVYKPELIFFSKCNGVPSNIIKRCTDKTKTWLWFMDYHHNVTDEILTHVKYATFASATSTEVVERFKEVNPNSHWIIEGYDQDIMYPMDSEKIYDVVFIGNATEKRIEQLRKARDVEIFGDGWPTDLNANPPVYQHEFRKTVCKSKIVLNLVHGNIFSNRVVDSLACGVPVLSEYCDDLNKKFGTVYTFKDISKVNFEMVKLMNTKKSLKTTDVSNYSWKRVLDNVLCISNGCETCKEVYYG